MKHQNRIYLGIFTFLGMFVLIFDGKTAISGAHEGITLCLHTLIPSLFPFLVLSSLINSLLIGREITFLRPIGKLCGIPSGAESILLLGLLGGYPVGAQSIADAYGKGYLSKSAAHRLLGFCNNAGPAFVFGIIAAKFASPSTGWLIGVIHILSALIVGFFLPNKDHTVCTFNATELMTLPQALDKSIKTMAKICGWVVLFRVLLSVLRRWLFWLIPLWLQVLLTGTLELANGCVDLHLISNEGLRFLLAVCMLSFGGLCVGMQTISVTKELGCGLYFPGKLLQSIISILLAERIQHAVFPPSEICHIPILRSLLYALVMMLISAKTTRSLHKSSSTGAAIDVK